MDIKIFYGPYKANYIIRHKKQRLYGVQNSLINLGYNVELVPTEYLNVMTMEMKNRQFFRCDIRNLKFNMDCDDDNLCLKILAATEDTRIRIESGCRQSKYGSMLQSSEKKNDEKWNNRKSENSPIISAVVMN